MSMEEYFENETIGMDTVLEEACIIGLKIDMKKLGDKKIWEMIEGFKSPIARARIRRIFFKAGGKCD